MIARYMTSFIQINKTTLKKLSVLLCAIASLLVIVNIIYSPIYGDEGFYHGEAHGKNVYGYYTSPYLYDIPTFQEHSYYHIHRSIIQLYRLSDIIFKDAIYGIKAVRIITFCMFVWALYFYLKKLNLKIENWETLGILSVIISYPIISSPAFLTGREDVILSALLLFILGTYHSDINNRLKILRILFLSTLMLFFHPNGILYMAIIAIIGIDRNNPIDTITLWALILLTGIVYYLVFIDPNYKLFVKQSILMNQAGGCEKVITNISSLPSYVLAEIRDRYFMWSQRIHPKYIILVISMIVPLLAGLYAGFKSKNFKMEMVYILSTMAFFIILGSKHSGYLIYFYPILIIMTFYLFRGRKKCVAVAFALIIFVNMTLVTRHIVWSYYNHKKTNNILNIIEKEVKPGETIYAASNWEPYLSTKYKYLMTTQKDLNNLYQLYNIRPKNCIIMESKNNEIWKWANDNREKIAKIKNLLIYRIH